MTTLNNKYSYSISEACHVLCVGRTKLYSEISKGRLKAKKFGNRTIITSEAIQEWLSSLPSYK